MKIHSSYIEITDNCNLNCKSCYNSSNRLSNKHELPFEQFREIVERLRFEFCCSRIVLSGGEPLLHSQFRDILIWILSQSVEVVIVTNGTLINHELVEAYNNYNNLSLQVSLDGSTEAINALTRGCGNYNKVLGFLSLLNCSEERLRLKMTISKLNCEDVMSFYDFALSLKCLPEYSFISQQGNACMIWNEMSLTSHQKLNVLWQIYCKNQEYGKGVQLPYCTTACPLSDKQLDLSVLIKTDATVQPCQLLYDTNYSIGNILINTAEEFDEFYTNRICSFVQKRECIDFGCARCLARYACKGGCLANAIINTRDPFGNDGDCEYRKLQLLGFDVM